MAQHTQQLDWLDELLHGPAAAPSPQPEMALIERYAPEKHGETLKAWLAGWGIPFVPELVPQTGYVVGNAAIGFLMKTDTTQVQLERFITNPELPEAARGHALRLLVQALESEAAPGQIVTILVSTAGLEKAVMESAYRPVGQYALYQKEKQ